MLEFLTLENSMAVYVTLLIYNDPEKKIRMWSVSIEVRQCHIHVFDQML